MRTYVITGGRAYPTHTDLRPETLLVATAPGKPPKSANAEQHRLLSLCRGVLSVAEAAAHLRLPVSAIVVLVSDLADSGDLVVRSAPRSQDIPDLDLLERVLDGLLKL